MRRSWLVLVSALSLFADAPDAAATRTILDCQCAPRAELTAYRDRIAAAPTLEAARELAVTPVAQARSVVSRLTWAAASLGEADARMADFEEHARAASTPAELADAFGVLVKLDAPKAIASRSGHSGCSYSTGEIIAIVLGFILAIIPGIILLILLC